MLIASRDNNGKRGFSSLFLKLQKSNRNRGSLVESLQSVALRARECVLFLMQSHRCNLQRFALLIAEKCGETPLHWMLAEFAHQGRVCISRAYTLSARMSRACTSRACKPRAYTHAELPHPVPAHPEHRCKRSGSTGEMAELAHRLNHSHPMRLASWCHW